MTPPVSTAPSAAVSAVQPPVGPDVVKMMDEVLSSDNGVTIMINRLKESIASAKVCFCSVTISFPRPNVI